jgi:hypothetical protein
MTMKEIFSQPNTNPRREAGKVWTRTLAIRCHWCQDIFYGYQADGEEQQPYQTAQLPGPVRIQGYKDAWMPGGQRPQCSGPLCAKASEDEYFSKHDGYQRAVRALSEETRSEVKITKGRGGLVGAGR